MRSAAVHARDSKRPFLVGSSPVPAELELSIG